MKNELFVQTEIKHSRDKLVTAGLILLLAIGSLLIYFPALQSGFVWDDDVHFTANDAVRRWWGIVDIWTTRAAVYYPLVLTTGWVIHKIAGFNPVIFHALTLLLHIANALLLVLILRRFRLNGAWLAGFLFAWHPMQVESVAWVTELKNTQSAFFLFLSILTLHRTGFFQTPTLKESSSRRWFYLSVVLFALAILSKPSVVMIPVALAAVVWWRRGLRRWLDIDTLFPFFMLSILAAGWTVWEQRYSSGAQGFEWSMSLLERTALAGQVFWFYLLKLAWPTPVMFLYPKWDLQADRVVAYLPFVMALLMGFVFWWKRNQWGKAPGIILFWFGVMLFPVMGFFNVYFMRYAWVADHFIYLPAISLFAGVGLVWSGIARRQRAVAVVLAVAIIAACAVISHRHVRTFRDQETLWRSAIAANPGAWIAYNNLGSILRARGDREGARQMYDRALSINSKHYEAMNNLGILHLDEQEVETALNYFDQAIALRPDLYMTWINRGFALEKLNRFDDALRSYLRAAAINPKIDTPLVNIGMLAEKTGDVEKIVESYRTLLKRKKLSNTEIGAFLFERAYHIKKDGRPRVAMNLLDKAAELAPSLPDIYLLQGELNEQLGEYDAAVKSYRKAVSYRPDWGAVLLRLSRVLAAHPDFDKRNPQEALFIMEGMLSVSDGKVTEIYDVYAMALAAAGRFGDAMKTQRQAMSITSDTNLYNEMVSRLELYERGESYTLPRLKPEKP